METKYNMTPEQLLHLSLGIPDLDSQHSELITSFVGIENAIKQGNFQEIPARLFNVKQLTLTHFLTEEKLMDEIGFPDSVKHKKDHLAILELLDSVTAMPHVKATTAITQHALYLTIISHLKIYDLELANFYHNQETFKCSRFQNRKHKENVTPT